MREQLETSALPPVIHHDGTVGTDSRTRAIVAVSFAALLVALLAFNRLFFVPDHGWVRARPAANSGDEPHYVLVLSSLLRDRDLDVRNNYDRVVFGGLDAGVRFQDNVLDHHTLVVDVASDQRARWYDVFEYSEPRLACAGPGCVHFPQKMPQLATERAIEVPLHSPFYPLAMAALLSAFDPSPETLEHSASIATVVLCWVALVAIYCVCRRASLPRSISFASVLLVGIASPWLPYTRGFFSEPLIGVALALALWGVLARRPGAAGVALAAAVLLKPPFVLVAAAWIMHRLWVGRVREALVLAGTVATGGVCLAVFNWRLAGTPMISVVFDLATEPWDTWFGAERGLYVFVPWALFGSAFAVAALRRRPACIEDELITLVAAAFLPFVVVFTLKGPPGDCYGPRFWVPLLPLLGVATVVCARRARAARLAVGIAVVWALLVAATGAVAYPFAFNESPLHALGLILR